jgi:AraC-like DNA-binding protein
MSKPHSKTHSINMTPAQAAQVAGVSRWSIMRAIKSQQLEAIRDNRNNWKITEANLIAHYTHSVQNVQIAHPDDSAELRVKLASETARANAAENARDQAAADRDRWQHMAEKLAEGRQFKWPWQR